MKKFLFVIFLALLLVGCGVPQDEYNSAMESAQKEIGRLEGQLETAQSELNETKNEIEQLSSEIDIANLELESIQNELSTTNTEVERLVIIETDYYSVTEVLSNTHALYDDLMIDYEDLESKHKTALSQKSLAESKLSQHKCSTQLSNMKYEGILDVSTILMGWYARQSHVDMVHNSYRDTIWNNTDTKIHSINYRHTDGNSYVDHFLVYFDEFGWEKGVYWLSEQCWLTGGP